MDGQRHTCAHTQGGQLIDIAGQGCGGCGVPGGGGVGCVHACVYACVRERECVYACILVCVRACAHVRACVVGGGG